MALINITSGTVSADFNNYSPISQDGNLLAGAVLGAGDACRIASDGLVYQTVTTAGDSTGTTSQRSSFDGFVLKGYALSEPVTLFSAGSVIGNYAASMTPGTVLYASATLGALSDAVILANDQPVAKAISGNDIRVLR